MLYVSIMSCLLIVLLTAGSSLPTTQETQLTLTNPTELSQKNSHTANRAINGGTAGSSYYQSADQGVEQWIQFDVEVPAYITKVVIVDR